jgi:hypothetical protein
VELSPCRTAPEDQQKSLPQAEYRAVDMQPTSIFSP